MKHRRALGFACVLTAMALALPLSAAANDSTASIDVGGLALTYNPDIAMESEDLYLSKDEVRIAYTFRNKSDHDISTLVAFPLPTITMDEEGNYDFSGRKPEDLMDFEITVDGKPVTPKVELRATRFGVDVTEVLKRHGIPPIMTAATDAELSALSDRLDNLPEDARAELARYGVIDWNTSFGAEDKPLANTHWDAHLTYYWFQTFPAGRTVEVKHKYKPVPRAFLFGKYELGDAGERKTYCMDQSFINAAQAMLKQASQDILPGTELKYVLTTGANWAGPIGTFKLTVEKPSPKALISLCADGIKKTGPTTFTLTEKNFNPENDLAVLFVEPMQN